MVQVVGPFKKRRDAKTTLMTLDCLLHGAREPDTAEWMRNGRFFSTICFLANCAQVIMAHIKSLPQSTRDDTVSTMFQRFAPDAAEEGPHALFLRDSGIRAAAVEAAAARNCDGVGADSAVCEAV